MKSPICEMLGAEFPLVAFSHCKDVVVAAVSYTHLTLPTTPYV